MDISKLQDTAYYVFDFRVLGQRIDDLRGLLGEKIRLAYAIKANPFLVKGALPRVERLELCSPGESRICDALGVESAATVISGIIRDEAGQTVDYLLCSNTTNYTDFPAGAYYYTSHRLIKIYGWNESAPDGAP